MTHTRAHVALGSNLGDRATALVGARDALDRSDSLSVVAASRIWETAPVGPPGQGPYLNAVIAVETALSAGALLERLLEIERRAGRDRSGESVRWGPRVLDLDLLLFGDEALVEPGLEVPHPRLHERAFVLLPLCEIAGGLVHPTLGGTMASHLVGCPDRGEATPWEQGETDDAGWRPLPSASRRPTPSRPPE